MKRQKIYRKAWMEARVFAPQSDSDQWYVDFANRLLPLVEKSAYIKLLPAGQEVKVTLYLTWYLEDCINNMGGWNRFIWFHSELYGRYLPFYTLTDEYMADEVNPEDVKFILWSLASVVDEDFPVEPADPFDPVISEFADEVYALLDAEFENAPITDYDTGDWLPDIENLVIDGFDEDLFSDEEKGLSRQEKEDLLTIVPGEYCDSPDVENFIRATKDEQLMYFKTYEDMRIFMTEKLDWLESDLIPGMERQKEFVMFATHKGVLIAPGVAACFADKRNPMYDPVQAAAMGKTMFYVRGRCPSDLLKYAMMHNLLPDAAFSFPDGQRILHENWDFIARRYLGFYYDDDED